MPGDTAHAPLRPASLLCAAALLAAACTAQAHGPARALPAEPDATAQRAQERQRTAIFRARYPDRETATRAAVTLHDALLETRHDLGWQVFELDAEQVGLLRRFGYRLEPDPEFVARRDAFLDALDAAAARRRAQGLAGDAGIQAIPGYACYETVEETYAAALGFTATYPQLAQWLLVGQSWQKTVGQGGYDIGVLKLTNQAVAPADGSAKPRLFVHAAMHAREYVTAPLALAFARWLLQGWGSNADATWLLDHHEVHLMLHVNPDGRKRAETGLSWRKNTNTAYCGSTSNSRGADLNRNFTFGWNSTAGQGSSGSACSATYRGPSPSSEPETRAVEAYVRSLWPDRRGPNPGDAAPADTSGIHIDLHSYSELVLWPWGTTASPAPNGAALATLGRRLAWFNGYRPTQSIGLYPTDGTSDGVSYGELGVAAFTFELGTSFFQTCDVFEGTIRPNNLPALVYAAKVARAPYLLPGGPEVTAAAAGGGQPVPAGLLAAVSASATDTRFNQSNGSEPVQPLAAAFAYVGAPPWQAGAVALPLQAADGAFDSATEALAGSIDTGTLPQGRHLVYLQAGDASGRAGPVTATFLDVGPPRIALTFQTGNLRQGIALNYSGATTPLVDVYRDGLLAGTRSNTGLFVDPVRGGSFRYRVCEAGTAVCSPVVVGSR